MTDFITAAERKRRMEALRLFRLYMATYDAWRSGPEHAHAIGPLHTAMVEACAAYERHGVELDCDYSDEPWICGLSGVPLVEGDEYVVDPALSHIRYLRAACKLPPRRDEPPAPTVAGNNDADLLPTIAELFACR